jgi:hypothetical protein
MFRMTLFLVAATVSTLAAEKEIEWTALFDGKTTNGWTPRAKRAPGAALRCAAGRRRLPTDRQLYALEFEIKSVRRETSR